MARRPTEPASQKHAAALSPLAAAEAALARGQVARARQLAREALSSPDASAARALLERTKPDPTALLVAGGVLVLILFALWAAILHHH